MKYLMTLALLVPIALTAQAPRPRLVLQMTVDQLRGDLPFRYYDRFGDGGFRYLIEQGAIYRDAHHAHANTETIVGHTTLAKGAHPSAHGMIGNLWFDREHGYITYNIEDPRYRLVSAGADVDAATEIDPTQRAARSEGRSPAAIMVSTFSDELAISTAGRGKIFGVSIKDRGAVSMAVEIPDYLGISFSSTDYVGHLFGPSSLESEENLLHLDRMLADLFAFVDERVGLARTLIVLSADHGAPEVPGYLAELGIPAGYVDPDSWDREPAIAALQERFGVGKELIATYAHPYVYLNQAVLRDGRLDAADVERAVAEELVKFPGVAVALSTSALREGSVPEMPLTRAIMNNFNPTRSGDVFVVFEPQWFINDFDGLEVAATHGSPWRYDTFVPIMFAGANVPARIVDRRVHTIDVALTLARYMGTGVPSGSAGAVLEEIFSSRAARQAN